VPEPVVLAKTSNRVAGSNQ